jgi:E3 ubiquitin-protein ligase RAD18
MCPICQKQVKETDINAHIDRACMDEPRVTKAPGGKFSKGLSPAVVPERSTKRPERLPQLNYSMVKDNALRKKLVDMGLSAGGSRQLMEKRYTEWITLCNANCDATHPKTKGELKRELDVWERTQGGKAPSSNFTKDPGSQIKEKDFDGQAWSSKHDDSFKALIANARRKPKASMAESTLSPTNIPDSSAALAAPTASLSLSAVDVAMPDKVADHELGELSPTKQTGSESRFFQESNIDNDISPSSKYRSKLIAQEGIVPDIATN